MTSFVISLAFVTCVGVISPFVGKAVLSAIRKEKDYISQLFDKCIHLNEELKTKLRSALSKSSITRSEADSIVADAKNKAELTLLMGRESISDMAENLLEGATRQLEIRIAEEQDKLVDIVLNIAAITTEELVRKDAKSSDVTNRLILEMSKHVSKTALGASNSVEK